MSRNFGMSNKKYVGRSKEYGINNKQYAISNT